MRCKRRFGVAVAVLAFGTTAADADVLIQGTPDAVHVEAHQASLREVLDAMQATFNLRYRTADALDRPVTGIFDGSLQRVAARILDGYDFAMTVTPNGIELLVLPQNQRGPVVAALQRAATPAPPRPMTAQEANRRERGLSH